MVREIKKLTAVFNPLLGFVDQVYADVAMKGPGFLGAREVGCPHPE
jgi:hypothetical protein